MIGPREAWTSDVRDEAWPALPLVAARSLAAASLETAAAAGARGETRSAPPLAAAPSLVAAPLKMVLA